jgi:hypothetical protein
MPDMGLVAIGAILFAVLLLVIAAMVWQETRLLPDPQPVYVIEEAVPFVMGRLGDGAMARLDRDDILRILEWEVHYLQGLDLPRDHSTRPSPVAGSDHAIDFIVERSGHIYDRADVAEVLAGEVEYLIGIGAVGAAVEEGK